MMAEPALPPTFAAAGGGNEIHRDYNQVLKELTVQFNVLEKSGDVLGAMQCEERMLACRKEMGDRDGLVEAAEKLCIKYNSMGVRSFKSGKYEQAMAFFSRSMKLTEDEAAGSVYFEEADQARVKMRAATLNNLGCMERRRGDFDVALKHLMRCSKLEGNNSAATNLNISAILTQAGRHQEAIGTARRSIGLLSARPDRLEDVSLLVIGYHNLGMAQECSPSMDDRHDAAKSYNMALQIAKRELGPAHTTTLAVTRSIEKFKTNTSHPKQPHPQPSLGVQPPRKHHKRPDTLPPISPLAQVSQPPANMLTTEELQAELNPSYAGETGLILVEKHHTPSKKKQTKKAKKTLARRQPPPRPTIQQEREAHSVPQPPKEPKPLRRDNPPRKEDRVKEKEKEKERIKVVQKPAPPLRQVDERAPRQVRPGSGEKKNVQSSVQPPAEVNVQPRLPTPPAENLSAVPKDRQVAAKRRGRYDEGRDDDKKKEDAVTYMHQVLIKLLKDEDVFEQQFQAALRIQCALRCMAARNTIERKKGIRHRNEISVLYRENEYATVVTRFMRKVAQQNAATRAVEEKELAELDKCNTAAVMMQKHARGWLARRKTKWLRTYYRRMNWAVKALQCFFRRTHANIVIKVKREAARQALTQRRQRELHRVAATRIQKVWRGYYERKLADAMKGKVKRQRQLDGEALRQHEAMRMSAWWKGHLARQRARAMGNKREARRLKQETSERRNAAGVTIQRAWLRYYGVLMAEELLQQQKSARWKNIRGRRQRAAVCMQCFVRCMWAVREAKRLRAARMERHAQSKLDYYATHIAAVWKGYMARVVFKYRKQMVDVAMGERAAEMDKAAARIQGLARGHLTRKKQLRAPCVNEVTVPHPYLREQAPLTPVPPPSPPSAVPEEHTPTPVCVSRMSDASYLDDDPGLTALSALVAMTRKEEVEFKCLHLVYKEAMRAATPADPEASFMTTTEKHVLFTVQDKLPVAVIDGLFSHYVTSVTWNRETRYITLARTVPDGEDTVQVQSNCLLKLLDDIHEVCLAGGVQHNLENAVGEIEEANALRIQCVARRWAAKKEIRELKAYHAKREREELEGEAVLFIQKEVRRVMGGKVAAAKRVEITAETQRVMEEDAAAYEALVEAERTARLEEESARFDVENFASQLDVPPPPEEQPQLDLLPPVEEHVVHDVAYPTNPIPPLSPKQLPSPEVDEVVVLPNQEKILQDEEEEDIDSQIREFVDANARKYLETALREESQRREVVSTPCEATPSPEVVEDDVVVAASGVDGVVEGGVVGEHPLKVLKREIEEEERRLVEGKVKPGAGRWDVEGMRFDCLQDAEGKNAERNTRDPSRRVAAASTIQRAARGRAAKQDVTRRRGLIKASRANEAGMSAAHRSSDPLSWREEDEAAVVIQGLSKIKKAKAVKSARSTAVEENAKRQADVDERNLQNTAAVKIQCRVRAKIAECDYAERSALATNHRDHAMVIEQSEDAAALTIQLAWRCAASRKAVNTLRHDIDTARESDIMQENVMTIQRVWRGYHVRSEFDTAARRIQGLHLMKKSRGLVRLKQAAILQSVFQEDAAIKIQNTMKTHQAKREKQRRKDSRESQRLAKLQAGD